MKPKSIFLIITFILVLILLPIALLYSQEGSELTLNLTLDQNLFELGESIWITSKITNISDHTIALPKHIMWDEMKLTHEGDKPQRIISDGLIITKKDDFILLSHGEYREHKFDLTKSIYFKLTPGVWKFQIIEAYSAPSGLHQQGWTGTLESNELVFEIK